MAISFIGGVNRSIRRKPLMPLVTDTLFTKCCIKIPTLECTTEISNIAGHSRMSCHFWFRNFRIEILTLGCTTRALKHNWLQGRQYHWGVSNSHLFGQKFNWQTFSHNVYGVHPEWAWFKLTTLEVIGIDCIGSCKSNYHTITTMTALLYNLIWSVLYILK